PAPRPQIEPGPFLLNRQQKAAAGLSQRRPLTQYRWPHTQGRLDFAPERLSAGYRRGIHLPPFVIRPYLPYFATSRSDKRTVLSRLKANDSSAGCPRVTSWGN